MVWMSSWALPHSYKICWFSANVLVSLMLRYFNCVTPVLIVFICGILLLCPLLIHMYFFSSFSSSIWDMSWMGEFSVMSSGIVICSFSTSNRIYVLAFYLHRDFLTTLLIVFFMPAFFPGLLICIIFIYVYNIFLLFACHLFVLE